MYSFKCFLFIVLLIVLILSNCNGERTRDKMYERINGAAACFMRLNGTHKTGCTSNRKGSTGVVHLAKTLDDIQWLLKNGNAGPYMAVINPSLFTPNVLSSLKKHYPEKISGVILTNTTQNSPANFSGDYQCPNPGSSLDGTCDSANGGWNLFGNGLLFEDYPFPMFMVSNETEIKKITDCFEKFNNHDLINQRFRSLCALQLNSFMYAAVDTETCLRRTKISINFNPIRYCDALGDRNVWATLFPRGVPNDGNATNEVSLTDTKDEKLIVIAARLDDTSLFDGITPGAINPVSGVITLLSTAYILKEIVSNTTNGNVLFLILNGEAYDYIGSQKVVYDMENGNFPIEDNIDNKYPNINLDNISLFIELSQISNTQPLNIFHMSYEDPSSQKTVNDIISNMKKNNITPIADVDGKIPPSSLQTFLKAKRTMPGIVLATHGEHYRNKYYHSIYDNAANLNFTYLNVTQQNATAVPKDSIQMYFSNISNTIAASVYQALNASAIPGPHIDTSWLVDDLLYCYLISPDCKLFTAATFDQTFPNKPMSLYIGVVNWLNSITSVTGATLALLTGDRINTTKASCSKMQDDQDGLTFRYSWVHGNFSGNTSSGECLRSTMNFTIARSPAFDVDDYDWKSGIYSSWTESTWSDLSMQMFLKPSAQHENVTITIGSAVLILSFIIVYVANRKSDILFNNNTNIIGTSC